MGRMSRNVCGGVFDDVNERNDVSVTQHTSETPSRPPKIEGELDLRVNILTMGLENERLASTAYKF